MTLDLTTVRMLANGVHPKNVVPVPQSMLLALLDEIERLTRENGTLNVALMEERARLIKFAALRQDQKRMSPLTDCDMGEDESL